jgi:hypothetical protein
MKLSISLAVVTLALLGSVSGATAQDRCYGDCDRQIRDERYRDGERSMDRAQRQFREHQGCVENCDENGNTQRRRREDGESRRCGPRGCDGQGGY